MYSQWWVHVCFQEGFTLPLTDYKLLWANRVTALTHTNPTLPPCQRRSKPMTFLPHRGRFHGKSFLWPAEPISEAVLTQKCLYGCHQSCSGQSPGPGHPNDRHSAILICQLKRQVIHSEREEGDVHEATSGKRNNDISMITPLPQPIFRILAGGLGSIEGRRDAELRGPGQSVVLHFVIVSSLPAR